MALLGTVYGFTPDLDGRPGERVEFGLHPLAAGVRQTHTIVWEREPVDAGPLTAGPTWPNRFSRFLGDKAFGLLVADLLGLPVPATTAVGRRVAPFSFGRPTGSGERWLRTCPAEPVPGRFLTQRGWRDPYALLAAEDPAGTELAAVLAQEGSGPVGRARPSPTPPVACWSRGSPGSATTSCSPCAAPASLPEEVLDDVRGLGARAAAALGPVRFEWSHDGHTAWVLQLHLTQATVSATTIPPRHPVSVAPVRPVPGPGIPARPDRHCRRRRGHRAHRRRWRDLPRRRPAQKGRHPVAGGRRCRPGCRVWRRPAGSTRTEAGLSETAMTTTPVRTLGYVAAAWCIGFAGVSAWQLAAGPIGQSATGQRYAAYASGLAIMGVLVGLLKLAGAAVAVAAVLVGPGRPPRLLQLLGVALWGAFGLLPCTRPGTW